MTHINARLRKAAKRMNQYNDILKIGDREYRMIARECCFQGKKGYEIKQIAVIENKVIGVQFVEKKNYRNYCDVLRIKPTIIRNEKTK